MDCIKLRMIDKSNDRNNSDIVIFQKNETTRFDALSVAWKVIRNLGQGNYHPFTYSFDLEVAASDSYGNYTPHLLANPGELFKMIQDDTGNVLTRSTGKSTTPEEVQVLNSLEQGAINVWCYRDGRPLAVKSSVAPEQKAVFKFKPSLYIAVASQVQEGDILDSAIISHVNTEVSLLGVASADIVLTGGGPGPGSTPFRFHLENVRYL